MSDIEPSDSASTGGVTVEGETQFLSKPTDNNGHVMQDEVLEEVHLYRNPREREKMDNLPDRGGQVISRLNVRLPGSQTSSITSLLPGSVTSSDESFTPGSGRYDGIDGREFVLREGSSRSIC